jgi:hypothetical protein
VQPIKAIAPAVEVVEAAPAEEPPVVEAAPVEAPREEELPLGDAPAEEEEAPKAQKPKKKARPEAQRAAEPQRAQDSKSEAFGFVTIGAQPYALVRIDGQEVGVTPIMRKKLSAGTHEIQLVRPDTGEVRLKKVVTVADGEHQRITLP